MSLLSLTQAAQSRTSLSCSCKMMIAVNSIHKYFSQRLEWESMVKTYRDQCCPVIFLWSFQVNANETIIWGILIGTNHNFRSGIGDVLQLAQMNFDPHHSRGLDSPHNQPQTFQLSEQCRAFHECRQFSPDPRRRKDSSGSYC